MNICSDMEIAALTHRGYVREVNEDRHYVKCLDGQALLMAVVDGMGGGPAGSAAAEIMREALTEYPAEAPNPGQVLSDLVVAASEAILKIARDDPALEGMGTTVTATYLSNGTAHWVHVGDTRFYVFRQGRLIQVTTDQTMAQLLVEEGRITPDEARTHPYGHMLDQCVGCPMCEPETGSFRIAKGDILLHTTDGLHDGIPENDITTILAASHASVEAVAKALIQAALDSGGQDNMTLVLASV